MKIDSELKLSSRQDRRLKNRFDTKFQHENNITATVYEANAPLNINLAEEKFTDLHTRVSNSDYMHWVHTLLIPEIENNKNYSDKNC